MSYNYDTPKKTEMWPAEQDVNIYNNDNAFFPEWFFKKDEKYVYKWFFHKMHTTLCGILLYFCVAPLGNASKMVNMPASYIGAPTPWFLLKYIHLSLVPPGGN